MFRQVFFALLLGATPFWAPLVSADIPNDLANRLVASAPKANANAIRLAVEAIECAQWHGMEDSERLAVIDYSRPSTEPRLWVFDLKKPRLLYQELVAHGRNSGDNYANAFSNTPESLQSSLGLFRTDETYLGKHGYSLRLDGLEQGFNDNARERAIVMHGAPYVDARLAKSKGRLGRSWGCPAVSAGVARRVIDSLKGGQFIFSYYPDQRWLARSEFLNCRLEQAMAERAVRHN